MEDRMITFKRGDARFTYRVAGVALHHGRVLLQQALSDGFWILPGGRAELLEELATEVAVVRLLWVVENFFVESRGPHHEMGLYFLMTFPEGSPLYSGDGPFAVNEAGVEAVCRWHLLEELHGVDLVPSFLVEALRAIPETTQHIVQRDG